MPVDGRIRAYYWNLRTFLEEKATILNPKHPDHRFPEDDNLLYYTHYLEGCLVFTDGSRLRFQYDNSPHHLHLSTFPHHLHKGPVPRQGSDTAWDCDLAEVSFIAVVSRIEELLTQ